MPPPYDVHNFLRLLGIEVNGEHLTGRFTVTHGLIAGTGYLWAPVVVALADALCAFGVGSNFLSSAREGEVVAGVAQPVHLGTTTQVWDAIITNETTGRRMAVYRCTQLMLYERSR